MLTQCVRYGFFPFVFSVALWGAIWSVGAGNAPLPTILIVCGLAGALIIACERALPFHAPWNKSHGDVGTDVMHGILSTAIVPEIFRVLFLGLLTQGAVVIAEHTGGGFWPSQWSLFAQLCVAAVIAELGQYWVHRIAHEREFLWRLHATHHSAPRLYWLNAGRFHPLDTFIQYGSEATLLILCGAGPELMTVFTVYEVVLGLLQHSNVDVRLGPLNYVFSMAELHRWHHSRDLKEANTNYGSNIILWDLVFGTFFYPKGSRPSPDIGIADMPRFPMSYLAQVLSPFTWKRYK